MFSLSGSFNNQIVEQSANIEFILIVSFVDLYNATFTTGTQLMPGQGPQIQIPIRFSVTDAVNQGLNVAIESFEETTPMKKTIQNTYNGFFIDTYDVAPPLLNVNIAVEMPDAVYKQININYDVTNSGPSIVSQVTSAILNSVSGIFDLSGYLSSNTSAIPQQSAAQQLFTNKSSSVFSKSTALYMSFIGFMEILQLIVDQRNFRNSQLYFLDFGRRKFHKIALLSTTSSSSVGKLNVLFYNINAVITQANTAVPSGLATNLGFLASFFDIASTQGGPNSLVSSVPATITNTLPQIL